MPVIKPLNSGVDLPDGVTTVSGTQGFFLDKNTLSAPGAVILSEAHAFDKKQLSFVLNDSNHSYAIRNDDGDVLFQLNPTDPVPTVVNVIGHEPR